MALTGLSQAATINYNIHNNYSGISPAYPATAADPWLRMTIADVATDQVAITFEAVHLTGGEFVSEWDFNFQPEVPTTLTFSPVIGLPSSGSYDLPVIGQVANSYKAGSDKYYDINLMFESSNANSGVKRFTQGDVLVYNVTGSGITAGSFDYYSDPGGAAGPFHSAAHIQNTPNGEGCSVWVSTAPEPSAAIYSLLTATVGFALSRKRRDSQL